MTTQYARPDEYLEMAVENELAARAHAAAAQAAEQLGDRETAAIEQVTAAQLLEESAWCFEQAEVAEQRIAQFAVPTRAVLPQVQVTDGVLR
jgi:hypothetical protein